MYVQAITLVVPTRDHPEYIRYLLTALQRMRMTALVVILDSSADSDTQRICESIEKNLQLRYVRLNPTVTADEKILYALKMVDTDYLWICGDGLIPEEQFFHIDYQKEGIQVLHLVNLDSRDCRNYMNSKKLPERKVYTDPIAFFSDFFWTATFMGSLIINRKVAEEILKLNTFTNYINTGFAYICALLDYISQHPTSIHVWMLHYFTPNPAKREAIWMKSRAIFDIWACQMPKAIHALPNAFDNQKEGVICTTAVLNQYLSRRGLIRWRSKGIYNKQVEQTYFNELNSCTNVSASERKLISRLPRFICILFFLPFRIRNFFVRKKSNLLLESLHPMDK